MRRADRGADTAHGLKTLQYRAEHLPWTGTELLAEGEYRRNHHATGMSNRGAVEVIGFGNVSECTHQQRLASPVQVVQGAPAPQNFADWCIATGIGAGERVEGKQRRLLQVVFADGFGSNQGNQVLCQAH